MRRLISLVMVAWMTAAAWSQQMALPTTSIPLNSPDGERLLLACKEKADYWPLSVHLEAQANLAYCGPASAVMVLNSLNLKPPASNTHPGFRAFQQDNFFQPGVEKVLPQQVLLHRGATLEQLGEMIGSYGVKVDAHHADPGGLAEFRTLARAAVASGKDYVIINFLREPLNQVEGGHFSPLGAYDADTDRFLVMDVARFRYPPWWEPAADLFRSMSTRDSDSGKNRGYLIVHGV